MATGRFSKIGGSSRTPSTLVPRLENPTEAHQALLTTAIAFADKAESLIVASQEQHAAGLALVESLKRECLRADQQYEKLKAPINTIRNAILTAQRATKDSFEKALGITIAKCKGYEERAKAAADEERRRLEAAALERQRQENEQIAKQREAEAKKTRDPELKQELRREAAQARSAPLVTPSYDIQPAIATSDGLRDAEYWSAVVENEDALWNAAIRNPVLRPCFKVDEKYLHQQARVMKQAMNTLDGLGNRPFPGVAAVKDEGYARKGGGR